MTLGVGMRVSRHLIDVQEMVVDGATSDLYRPWAELMAQEFPI